MFIQGSVRRSWFDRRVFRFAALVVGTVTVSVTAFLGGAVSYRNGSLHETRDQLAALATPFARLRAMTSSTTAPVIALNMRFEDLQAIEAKRHEALSLGTLLTSADDEVDAGLAVGADTLSAKVRLKGDAVDHLLGSKWSFRVTLQGDARFNGMRRFSLQHPRTRGFDREWLFHRHAREEGILALRYDFVRLVLNGTDLGLYALEEHFSKELLESQDRREGPIIKFDEGPTWERRAYGRSPDLIVIGEDGAAIDAFGSGKLARSPLLRRQADAAQSLLADFTAGTRAPSEVFDVRLLARYLALCELYGSWHALAWHNVRFAYDPVRARLEPIAFDVNSNLATTGADLASMRMPWVRRLLADPVFAAQFAAEVERLTRPDQIAALQADWDEELDDVALLLAREWAHDPGALWRSIEDRAADVRGAFEVTNLAHGTVEMIDGRARLALYNRTRLPVEVSAVSIDGVRTALRRPVTLPAGDRETMPSATYVELPARRSGPVVLTTHIVGWPVAHQVALAERGRIPVEHGPPPANADSYPFLEATGDGYRTLPGLWEVYGDVALPEGAALTIEPGTTLRFGADAVFVIRGDVIAAGTAEAPIVLESRDHATTWSGCLIVGGESCRMSHVTVRRTGAIERDGWITTGGFTIYRMTAQLDQCRFEDARGEDALNIFGAEAMLVDCVFEDTVSDAFDGDFVTGEAVRCRFARVAGDAIDLSGADFRAVACRAVDITDKAVSAGEQTTLRIDGLDALRVGMGVVAKDRSRVEAVDVTVIDASVASTAAYQKKPEYGPAFLEVTGLDAQNCAPPLADAGSHIRLDGVVIVGGHAERLMAIGIK